MKKITPRTSLIFIIAVFIVVLCIVFVILVRNSKNSVKWFDDFETAREYAIKANKDIFLVFDGSSWNEESSQLKADVLDKEEFLSIVGKHFVPVCLDIPLDDGDSTFTEQQNKNIELSRIFAIPEVPAILIMTVNNQIYDTIEYVPAGTTLQTMKDSLEKAVSKAETISILNEKLNLASGEEKVKIIDELVSITPQDYIFQFYNLINTVPELDPTNKTGLVGKYLLIITHVASLEKFFNGEVVEAAEIYEKTALNPLLTADEKLEAYYKAATMCYYGGLNEKLKDYLTKAIAAAPDSENAGILKATLDKFIADELAQLSSQEAVK
ncbi:MAG: thioredoxin family protein [Treponemataceae bacterium]|nr:thioredoxin family protein [Treponemataceae bacterium]